MEIYLNTYGVKAQIISENIDFIELIKSNYEPFLTHIDQNLEPNIRIRFDKEAGLYARKMKSNLPRLGHGLYQGKNSIYWENEFGFSIFLKLKNFRNWEIDGYHFNLESQQ